MEGGGVHVIELLSVFMRLHFYPFLASRWSYTAVAQNRFTTVHSTTQLMVLKNQSVVSFMVKSLTENLNFIYFIQLIIARPACDRTHTTLYLARSARDRVHVNASLSPVHPAMVQAQPSSVCHAMVPDWPGPIFSRLEPCWAGAFSSSYIFPFMLVGGLGSRFIPA